MIEALLNTFSLSLTNTEKKKTHRRLWPAVVLPKTDEKKKGDSMILEELLKENILIKGVTECWNVR